MSLISSHVTKTSKLGAKAALAVMLIWLQHIFLHVSIKEQLLSSSWENSDSRTWSQPKNLLTQEPLWELFLCCGNNSSPLKLHMQQSLGLRWRGGGIWNILSKPCAPFSRRTAQIQDLALQLLHLDLQITTGTVCQQPACQNDHWTTKSICAWSKTFKTKHGVS